MPSTRRIKLRVYSCNEFVFVRLFVCEIFIQIHLHTVTFLLNSSWQKLFDQNHHTYTIAFHKSENKVYVMLYLWTFQYFSKWKVTWKEIQKTNKLKFEKISFMEAYVMNISKYINKLFVHFCDENIDLFILIQKLFAINWNKCKCFFYECENYEESLSYLYWLLFPMTIALTWSSRPIVRKAH